MISLLELPFLSGLGEPQQAKTEVILLDDYLMLETKEIPLPKNAVELEQALVFPPQEPGAAKMLLDNPAGIVLGREGNFYIADSTKSGVFVFDAKGDYLHLFGQRKGKRFEFSSPSQIVTAKDSVIILDSSGRELRFFQEDGQFAKSIKLPQTCHDIVVSKEAAICAAPVATSNKSPLVVVQSAGGKKILSFGKPLNFIRGLGQLNSRKIALDEQGDILVAFRYFPVLRKYSQAGDLLAEIRVDDYVMTAKEKLNLKLFADALQKDTIYAYADIILDVETYDGKIYLLGSYPRLEIIEMDGNGSLLHTYWKEYDVPNHPEAFLVTKAGEGLSFWVTLSAPDSHIELLKPKSGQK